MHSLPILETPQVHNQPNCHYDETRPELKIRGGTGKKGAINDYYYYQACNEVGLHMGGDLEGLGDGPCIRPPNILRSSVVGCA